MINFSGEVDLGINRELQEDAIGADMLDDDTCLLCIADGSGSFASGLNPAEIAINEVRTAVKRQYDYSADYFYDNIEPILKEAVITANRVLGVFHIVNEEKYAGYGCSLDAVVIHKDRMYVVHTGNTRTYLIKTGKKDKIPTINQLTIDHTKAYDLYMQGLLTTDQYHTHPDRLQLTSGLGIFADPILQSDSYKLREFSIILMTTDGIHYAIKEEPLLNLTLASQDTDSAKKTLIAAARDLKYEDNMSVLLGFVVQ